MKNLLILFLSISSAFASTSVSDLRKAALESSNCQNFVRFDDSRLFLGFGGKGGGQVKVIDLNNPAGVQLLPIAHAAIDAASSGNRLFVLTSADMEEWDLTTFKKVASYKTSSLNRPYRYEENPTGFYLYGNQLYISHGILGFSVFDIDQKTLIDQQSLLSEQLPLQSMAVDIAGTGDGRALIAMDNYSMSGEGEKTAFRGILVLDLSSHQIIHQVGGMDPGAESINVVGNRVIVGFEPPVWKYDLQSVLESSSAKPLAMLSLPSTLGMGIGKPSFDDVNMYGCFSQEQSNGQKTVRSVAVTRKELKLD